jgi:hypothetical protein
MNRGSTSMPIAIAAFMIVLWINRSMDYAFAGLIGLFFSGLSSRGVRSRISPAFQTRQRGFCWAQFL